MSRQRRHVARARFLATSLAIALVASPAAAQAAPAGSPRSLLDRARLEFSAADPAADGDERLERIGVAVFIAGALFDLYTTKQGLDAGLSEGNPFLRRGASRTGTLATAVLAKVGIGFTIGTLGKRGHERTRGRWYLSCGMLQLGLGLANLRTIERAGERSEPPTAGIPFTPTGSASSPAGPRKDVVDEGAVDVRRMGGN